MQTVVLRLPNIDRSYTVKGLTVEQATLVKIAAKGDKMKLVIGLLVQGVVEPHLSIGEADQLCLDHAQEAAQIAAEIIKLTTGK